MRTYKHAAVVLRKLLDDAGQTPAGLALAADVDADTLRRVLNGRQSSISIRILMNLARYFDLQLKDLIDLLS